MSSDNEFVAELEAMAAESDAHEDAAARGRKRILEEWEPPEFKAMLDDEQPFEGNAETAEPDKSLLAANKAITAKVDQTIGNWVPRPTEPMTLGGLRIVGLCVQEKLMWSSNSDILVTRFVQLALGHVLVAHPVGVYQYEHGSYRRQEAVGNDLLREMEAVLNLAAEMLRELSRREIAFGWGPVFGFLQNAWQGLATDRAPVTSHDQSVKRRKAASAWAFDAMNALVSSVTKYTGRGKGKDLLESFGAFFAQDDVPRQPYVDFVDGTFKMEVNEEGKVCFKQVPKEKKNQCYFFIPTKVFYKPDTVVREKLRHFLATGFAGSPHERTLDMAMEALAFMGETVPQVQLFMTGKGGNSKTAKTILRENVFAGHHHAATSDIFQKHDEFRIQGSHFSHVRVLTVQETEAGRPLFEGTWKQFVSGQALPCRKLYGKETHYYAWDRAAKYWETNWAFPSIQGDPANIASLKSFWRRIIVLEMGSSFTSCASEEDPEKKVFKEEAELTSILQSGDARLCYIMYHLKPFMAKYGPDDCRRLLLDPPAAIRQKSKRVVATMANGGVDVPEGWEDESTQEKLKAAAAVVVKKVHSQTAPRLSFKVYETGKMKVVPGVYKPSTKNVKTKAEEFELALQRWPYLLLKEGSYDVVRLMVDPGKIDKLLEEIGPSHVNNGYEGWGEVWEIKNSFRSVPIMENFWDPTMEMSLEEKECDTVACALKEQMNVVALAMFLSDPTNMLRDLYPGVDVPDMEISEEHKQRIQSVLSRFQEKQDGDFGEAAITYYRKHGIPGRRYPRGPAAIHLPRSCRPAAFFAGPGAGLFANVDVVNSFPTLLWNKLMSVIKDEQDERFQNLHSWVRNPTCWRAFVSRYMDIPLKNAKKVLLKVFHLGKPDCDLPLLWALAGEVRLATETILEQPDLVHLKGMFGARPNPLSSRLHYAISKDEDALLADVEKAIGSVHGARVVSYAFDGCVVHLRGASDFFLLEECLTDVGKVWKVTFTCKTGAHAYA